MCGEHNTEDVFIDLSLEPARFKLDTSSSPRYTRILGR